MLYCSSQGYFSTCDFRVSSNLKSTAIQFKKNFQPNMLKSIINSVKCATFAPTSNDYIYSRDYLTVNIWDVRKANEPTIIFNVTDYLD